MKDPEARHRRGISLYFGRRVKPALIIADWTFPAAKAPNQTHAHSHHLEIHYTVRGSQWYESNGSGFEINAGDIFIAQAGVQHSTGGRPIEKHRDYYIRIDMSLKKKLLGLSPPVGGPIYRALSELDQKKYSIGLEAALPLKKFFSNYPLPDDPLRVPIAVAACLEFLIDMFSAIQRIRPHKKSDLSPITQYIKNREDGIPSISAIARHAGLSAPRLREVFRGIMGVPLHDYVLRQKVEQAKRLLSGRKKSVTNIASELGFSTSQYFSTVFRRYVGCSPKKFRDEP